MRKILVKRLNTDLTSEACNIKIPTLVIWGDKDSAVDITDGEYLSKIISNSGFIIYENATHWAYIEYLNKTVLILENFFKEEKNEN